MLLFDTLLLAAALGSLDVFALAVPQAVYPHNITNTSELPVSTTSILSTITTASLSNITAVHPHTQTPGQTLDGTGSPPTSNSSTTSTSAAKARVEVSESEFDTPTFTPTFTTTTSSSTVISTTALEIPSSVLDTPEETETADASRARIESTETSFDLPVASTDGVEGRESVVVVPLTTNSGSKITATPRLEVTAASLGSPALPQLAVTSTSGIATGLSGPAISVLPYQPVSYAPAITSAPVLPGRPLYVGAVPIAPGSSAQVVDGTTYSLALSGDTVYVNDSPIPVIAIAQSSRPAVFMANTPILPGSFAHVVDGTPYSLAPSGDTIYVNDIATPVTAIAQVSRSAILVANTPIYPGSSAEIVGGTTYSLAPSSDTIYVNGSPAPVTVLAPDSISAVYVANTPILPENPAQVVSGTTFSLAASGAILYINGSPTPVSAFLAQQQQQTVSVADILLLPGSSAQVVSGTTYSLAPSGSSLYINGSPTPVSAVLAQEVSVADIPVSPGSSAQIASGTTYSLVTDGSVLYINGVASTVATGAVTTGVVGAILAGLAAGRASDSNAEATVAASGGGAGEGGGMDATASQTGVPELQAAEGGVGTVGPGLAGGIVGVLVLLLLWL